MKTTSQRGSRHGMAAALAALALAAGCSSSTTAGPAFVDPTSDDSGGGYGGSSSGGGSSSSGASGEGGGGAGSCVITMPRSNCEACLQTFCCAQASACGNDSSCATLDGCISANPNGDAGVSACNASATTAARQEYAAFASCLTNSCSPSCKSCHGVVAACSSRTSQSACTAAGCAWGGCTGAALACPGLNASQCGAQQGCSYDSASGKCTGVADTCNVLAAPYACSTQQGCTWQMGCTGTPTPCSSLVDQATCAGAGCVWR